MLTQLSVFSACRLIQTEKMPTTLSSVAAISRAATTRGWPRFGPGEAGPASLSVLGGVLLASIGSHQVLSPPWCVVTPKTAIAAMPGLMNPA